MWSNTSAINMSSYTSYDNILKTQYPVGNKLANLLIGYIYVIASSFIWVLLPFEKRQTGGYYLVVILIAVLFSNFAQKTNSKVIYLLFMLLSFSTLFFTLGFRDLTGMDDLVYKNIFSLVKKEGFFNYFLTSGMEPGYIFLNYIIGIFTDNYIYMQLVSSFIPLMLFYYAIHKYRNKIDLPMAVFLLCTMFYFQMISVSLVRMFIAMGIVLNSFDYIVNGKCRKFILLIFQASLFHYSALFMFILVYFFRSQKVKNFLLLVFILMPLIFLLIGKILVPIMGGRYDSYANIGAISFNLSTFDTIPIIALLLLFYKKNKRDEKIFKVLISIFSLSMIVSFYSSMVSLGRLVFYTNISLWIIAPLVSRKIVNGDKKILFNFFIISYGFLYLYITQLNLASHTLYLFPYKNIFFQI